MMKLFIYIYMYNLIKIVYIYNLIDKILIQITNKYLQKLHIQNDITKLMQAFALLSEISYIGVIGVFIITRKTNVKC
jgi:hypothetical protein